MFISSLLVPVSPGVSLLSQLKTLFLLKLETVAVLRSDDRGHSRHCHGGEQGHRKRRRCGSPVRPGAGAGCCGSAPGQGQFVQGSERGVLDLSLQPQSAGPAFDPPPLVINKLPGFSKTPELGPQAGAQASRAGR